MIENEIAQAIVPYCERLTAGRETVNTISNAAFVLVFIYGWWLHTRLRVQAAQSVAIEPPLEKPVRQTGLVLTRSLIVMPLLIGIGSALFHASPTHLTHALDIVPVCLFAMLALWLTLQRNRWKPGSIFLLFFAWIALTAIAAQWPELLAHSLFYLPTLGVLIVLAILPVKNKRLMTILALTFGTALLFRALDMPLCPIENLDSQQSNRTGSVGTHFLWHFLTALACVLCLHLALGHNPSHRDEA